MVKRARGFESFLDLAFQDDQDTVPSSGWHRVPFNSGGTRARQELIPDDTLGVRDELDPMRGPIDVDGGLDAIIDLRNLGYWLKGALGEPLTSQERATGKITFSGQPAANSTITLNGTTWTFVAAGATGNQTNIGANLAATLTALATNLNASADAQVVKCTYVATATELLLTHDVPGATGNTFTLAASATPNNSNGTVSGATLTGGGWKHLFRSGGPRYRGKFTFTGQPSNNETITLGGVTWTFKTSGATGNETNIQATLAETLATLATDLNASANATIALATYGNTATELWVEVDEPDDVSTFALAEAVTNATVSGAVVTTTEDLPCFALHSGAPKAQDPAFILTQGVRVDTFAMDWQRPGNAAARLGLRGYKETRFATSQVASSAKATVTRFSRFQGAIKKGGSAVRATAATLDVQNNAEGVPEIRDDGLVGAVQTGKQRIAGTITARYATKAEFHDPSESGATIDIALSYTISAHESLVFDMARVHLSRAGLVPDGPGPISVTYAYRAAKSGAFACSATLRNDVASYANGA